MNEEFNNEPMITVDDNFIELDNTFCEQEKIESSETVMECPITSEKNENFLNELHNMSNLKNNASKLKYNESSQEHFRRFFRNGDSEFDDRKSNYKFSRLGGKVPLYEEKLTIKHKEAIENLTKISNFLLKEFENGRIGNLSQKTLKNKLIDKINDTKRNIFFSLVRRAEKILNI